MAEGQGRGNPATDRLIEELERYAEARLDRALTGVGRRLGNAISARPLVDGGAKLGHLGHAVGHLGQALPGKLLPALAARASSHVAEAARKAMGGGRPAGGAKTLAIIEDIDVGVPVREAYDQWTQFQDFGKFAKGVLSVEQRDDATTDWRVKVAKSKRTFQGKITEQIPDRRIAWTSAGDKGTTRGVVTFHPLGDDLTKVLVVLEYSPKGAVERSGALFRAQGRRARLDLKLFRKFIMMRGEATGGWRGEIRDGEVVREDTDEERTGPEVNEEESYEDVEDVEDVEGEGEEEQEEEGVPYEDEEPYEHDESYFEDEVEEDQEEEPAPVQRRPGRRTSSTR